MLYLPIFLFKKEIRSLKHTGKKFQTPFSAQQTLDLLKRLFGTKEKEEFQISPLR